MRHDGDVTSQKTSPADTNPVPSTTHVPGSVDGAPDLSAAARDLARREAIVEAGDPAHVGAIVDVYDEGTDLVTVRFEADVAGYHGWQWSVTLAVLDNDRPTVSEVVLLPGPDALLAPEWVPWKQRIRGGDLRVGDLLPTAPGDSRLVPAYVQSDDPAVEDVAQEIGLGRVRVLSREGRAEAAERWHDGDFGPHSDMARSAPASCVSCAFFVPIAGALGQNFGVCTNIYSPADGQVVDMAYGCGAHSETPAPTAPANPISDTVLDDIPLDVYHHAGRDTN